VRGVAPVGTDAGRTVVGWLAFQAISGSGRRVESDIVSAWARGSRELASRSDSKVKNALQRGSLVENLAKIALIARTKTKGFTWNGDVSARENNVKLHFICDLWGIEKMFPTKRVKTRQLFRDLCLPFRFDLNKPGSIWSDFSFIQIQSRVPGLHREKPNGRNNMKN